MAVAWPVKPIRFDFIPVLSKATTIFIAGVRKVVVYKASLRLLSFSHTCLAHCYEVIP